MKGIIFTEFLDLVGEKYGIGMVDDLIENSELSSGGAYTAVGTYEFSEMLQLLTRLSSNVQISIDDLLLVYGEHFFQVLVDKYSELLNKYKDPLDLLASIENHIHVEVQKIYPDAELPTFKVIERLDGSLTMDYKSSRSMHRFGLGLMNKTFEYFGQRVEIQTEEINPDGTMVRFHIVKA